MPRVHLASKGPGFWANNQGGCHIVPAGALLPMSSADSQFYQMFDTATSPKRHGSLDMMLRPFSITSRRNLFAEGSVDSDGALRSHTLKTTDKLEVKKAGGRAVVNRQYMVIKVLGSGQYGRVSLVVNLNDLQLYALKTVSKAHLKKSIRRVRSSLGRRSMNNLLEAARKADAAAAAANAAEATAAAQAEAQEDAKAAASAGLETRATNSPKAPDMVREIAVMKKLDHPNIVKLHEVIDDPGTDSLLLVMEFVDGGTLEQPYVDQSAGLWQPLPEITVHKHFREICRGLDYLHYNHVIHGDLKPANLMRSSNGRVKIGDFGSALIYQEAEGVWDGQVDVWAAGVCIYVWVFGQLPFTGKSILDIFSAIKTAPLTFPDHISCSLELKDLLSKVLVKDPRERFSLEDMMRHEWVNVHNTMPCIAMRDTGGEVVSVTAADMASAISKQGREAMLPMIMPMFKEVYFLHGEVMDMEGDEGKLVFLLADGEAEVVVDAANAGPRNDTEDGEYQGDISPSEMLGMMSVESMTAIVSGTPRPWELGNGQMVVATHGPGEFVGLSALVAPHPVNGTGANPHSPGTIRARTNLMAYQASRQAMAAAMRDHPELKEVLQSQVWRQRSDQTVMEAISALHLGQRASV
ncbi:hypothetical protein WJX72_011148 [[Myrmecia] bisecta]|uniref:Uncharacterized protein n=1 Tax=[Myrmecia] bisecta TaxID=41462 RepID=A0AAW1PUP4_9CHLO